MISRVTLGAVAVIAASTFLVLAMTGMIEISSLQPVRVAPGSIAAPANNSSSGPAPTQTCKWTFAGKGNLTLHFNASSMCRILAPPTGAAISLNWTVIPGNATLSVYTTCNAPCTIIVGQVIYQETGNNGSSSFDNPRGLAFEIWATANPPPNDGSVPSPLPPSQSLLVACTIR